MGAAEFVQAGVGSDKVGLLFNFVVVLFPEKCNYVDQQRS